MQMAYNKTVTCRAFPHCFNKKHMLKLESFDVLLHDQFREDRTQLYFLHPSVQAYKPPYTLTKLWRCPCLYKDHIHTIVYSHWLNINPNIKTLKEHGVLYFHERNYTFSKQLTVNRRTPTIESVIKWIKTRQWISQCVLSCQWMVTS